MRAAAVTFDFWNTLFVPGGGPVDRAARLAAFLGAGLEVVEAAIREEMAANERAWRAGRQYGATEVSRRLAERFVADLSTESRARLLELVETPSDPVSVKPAVGMATAVRTLHGGALRLGVVSDTGWSPGRHLRGFLESAGVAGCFVPGALAFSDEVGVPKPDPRIFARALAGLGTRPAETVHVGDLRFTDVAGARAAGLVSVRYRGIRDDPGEGPEADYVIDHLDQLPGLLGLGG